MVLSKTNNNYVIIFNGQMIEVSHLIKDFQSLNWKEYSYKNSYSYPKESKFAKYFSPS